LNSPGGDASIIGLPQTYEAGKPYTFQIAINHSVANRSRWGFSILARNAAGQNVGSFSSTNNNAALNGAELSHSSAVATAATQSYTYQNLVWTAPANPGPNDGDITFYVVGLAGNGSGSGGDFVYASTKTISLQPLATTYVFTGSGNWSDPANWQNNMVPPSVLTGNISIIINPAPEGECVLDVPQTISGGATLSVADGKRFTINGNLSIVQ
jgi:hypothetical protein